MRQTTLCNDHINCFKSRNRIFALGRLLNIPVGAFRPPSTSFEALRFRKGNYSIPFNINLNTLIGSANQCFYFIDCIWDLGNRNKIYSEKKFT